MSRYMQHLACRFHPEAVLIEDNKAGDMICPMCGLVVGERMIDVSTEWREFGNETNSKSTSRVGAVQNLLYDNDNLETTTSVGTSAGALDELGRQKYGKKLSQISSADKALRTGNDAIRALAGRINVIKKVMKRAFLIFKYCYENKILRGRSLDVIVAACIYTACRDEGSARTMNEIVNVSTVSLTEIGRVYKKIRERLPNSVAPQSIEMKDLVPRFCNQLELKQEILIRKTAIHIAERANEFCDIQGRKPSSIAAASIYLACLAACEKITKKDIKGPTDVSERVIRDIYKIMLSHAAKLFPEDFIFKCPIVNLPVM